MRILVAETDLQLLAEMRQALEQAGHEVTVANDGMVAWGYLLDTPAPDLLMTRLHFGPGVPPGTALGLHAAAHHPRIPVVYIPATAKRAALADPEHGAILVKPFPMTDLVAAVTWLAGK